MHVFSEAIIVLGVLQLLTQQVFTRTLVRLSRDSPGSRLQEEKFQASDELCLSERCVRTAAEILKNMDRRQDPCDDFYSFACGRYSETHTIPDDEEEVSIFTEATNAINQNVRKLLEENIQKDDPPFEVKIKNFYKSCVDTEKIEKVGIAPLLDMINKLGGWPLLYGDEWNGDEFNWQNFILQTKLLGRISTLLLNIYISEDMRNNTRYVMQIDQPILSFSGKDYDDMASDYVYHVGIATLLGGDVSDRIKGEVADAMIFELNITQIYTPTSSLRDLSEQQLIPIGRLEEKIPSISWLSLINSLLPEEDALGLEDKVVVQSMQYLKRLDSLLSATDKRVLANSLVVNFLEDYISRTSSRARKLANKYMNNIKGTSEKQPRWRTCVDMTYKYFDAGVGSLYVQRYFNDSYKDEVTEMFRRIREEFTKILDEIPWMDPDTKREAKEKVQKMKTHIAYPAELLNISLINEYYEEVDIKPDTFFANTLTMEQDETESIFSSLSVEANMTSWTAHTEVIDVNTYYIWSENSIEIPAGILQDTFFSDESPRYMNYGLFGSLIGHEITHGFDDQGSQFDQDGNLRSWWKESTRKRYTDKIQCMIREYDNYTSMDIPINGVLTQGENVADNGGVKEAYRAYNTWVSESGPEKLLPGLPYTQNQLFWISFASLWCNIQQNKSLINSILYDEHPPGKFRVLGTVSNMPEFAQDFSCPQGSPMNPEKKCSVW